MKPAIYPLLLAGALCVIAGCGYKDDLYLPKPDKAAKKAGATGNAPAAAPSPAESR